MMRRSRSRTCPSRSLRLTRFCFACSRVAAKLLSGPPHTVLTDMQKRGEADLVVMGAIARGRIAELVLGNTAERVLHYGTGDVLVVTPPRAAA